jgi:hypothetical protein
MEGKGEEGERKSADKISHSGFRQLIGSYGRDVARRA